MCRWPAREDGAGRWGVGGPVVWVVACLAAAWPVVSRAADVAPGPAPAAETGAAWYLAGGALQPTVVQPLGEGRALFCTERWCQVYDRGTGRWTATEAVVLPFNTLATLCRRDGAVVAVDGARKVASEIWSPATRRWTAAAALPAVLEQLKTAELADGRILAVGQAGQRLRAYIADAGVTSWSVLVDSPLGPGNAWASPTRTGILLFTGHHVSRYTIGEAGWRDVALDGISLGAAPWLFAWGDDVLVVRYDTGEATLVERDGTSRRVGPFQAGLGFGFRAIAAARGATMWLVSRGDASWLWRRPDEKPILLPANAIEPPSLTVSIDEGHLLGIGASGAVTVLALDGRTAPVRPCDGLAHYLAQPWPPTPAAGSEPNLVGAACRDQVRRGEAGDVLARVRAWTADAERAEGEPAWSAEAAHADYARAFACALQDPSALASLPRWLANKERHARGVCYRSLATWPGADAVWNRALKAAVSKRSGTWYVDAAATELLVAVPTAEMRERFVPVVRTAADKRAVGFDKLRDQVCAQDPSPSAAREKTCAELGALHEAEWRRHDAAAAGKPVSPAVPILIATAVVGGATAGAYATRDGGASRAIATTAGVLGGLTLGLTVTGAGVVMSQGWSGKGGDSGEGGAIVAGALLGGVLGGIGAYAATASSASRAPVTAAGLALPYLFTIIVSFH